MYITILLTIILSIAANSLPLTKTHLDYNAEGSVPSFHLLTKEKNSIKKMINMLRKNCKQILEGIQLSCEQNPKQLNLINAELADFNEIMEEYNSKVKRKDIKTALWRAKSQFVYLAIRTKTYHSAIAKKLHISRRYIQDVYNKFSYSYQWLIEQEHLPEFTEYIYAQARIAYLDEIKKAEEFENSGILNKFVNPSPPKYWSLSRITESNKKIQYLLMEIKILNSQLSSQEINSTEFHTKKMKLTAEIDSETPKIRYELNRLNAYKGGEAVKNFLYIGSIPFKHLFTYDLSDDKRLRLTSVTKNKFLIREYCRWFNAIKYVNEIKTARTQKNNYRRKASYNSLNNNKKLEKEVLIRSEQSLIFKLLAKGKSRREIEKETGITYGTIGRRIAAIQQIVDHQ